MLVAAADELEEQVGGAGVVGEVAYLVDDEERRPRVVPEASFEGACGFLSIEVERSRSAAVVKRAVCSARMAWWAMFLASMVLPKPWEPAAYCVVSG